LTGDAEGKRALGVAYQFNQAEKIGIKLAMNT
jgi:hypothetical protein